LDGIPVFALLGISQGAAIGVAYAVRHPERVARLILYGGYARGWQHRGDPEGAREYNAIIELVRTSWGKENPAFRQIFTSRFIPGGSDEQLGWWNELCRKTTTPANAADLMTARSRLLATDLLPLVQAPTLDISGKTVRNHVSNVFDKIGVWTRAQAIVFARDRGFRR
jgi:pimeloyl-ACP methyl ester carboxylesterase